MAEAHDIDERAPVQIVDYDLHWPAQFAASKITLEETIGRWAMSIEHVGSTAVPGLAAKPIIDILVGVRRLEDARYCFGPLAAIGYEYVPEYEAEIPDRRYFRKGTPGARTHHLHMVEHGGRLWSEQVVFRDYLRSHPEVADEYARLKRALAARFGQDREGYTNAKASFVHSVLAKARRPSPAQGC